MSTDRKEKTPERKKSEKPSRIFCGMATNMLKAFLLVIRTYVEHLIDFAFSLYWDGQRIAIPDLENKHKMLSESAVSLAAKIRNKELKSEALVKACIERIKIVNPILNAVTDERFADALKDAQEVDKLIEAGLSDEYFKKKPFLGVPFTAKESHAVSGMLHTLGVVSRRLERGERDATCVRLVRAAGAIPVAVTNVPEINKWQECRNMLFGMTCNPHDSGRTTGGSSGGEAALSAALASPISLCSDIGGSTRMPAFYCGLFALNPSAGHTSLEGSTLRSGLDPTMASIGFVSKHLEDLVPLTKIVAAEKASDLNLDRQVDFKDIKLYYVEKSKDPLVSPVSKELRGVMKSVISKLSELSPGVVQPYYHEGLDHMFKLWKHAMTLESDNFARQLTNNTREAHALTELAKKIMGKSEYTMASIYMLLNEQVFPRVDKQWAEELTEQLRNDLISLLGDRGVMLFPSAPQVAPYHYTLLLRPYNFAYWAIFNALHFPALQVPLGVNSAGIPLGVQVVAAPRQEALCLAVARELEKHFTCCTPPCKILD